MELPVDKIQALAARQLTEREIALVLGIDLDAVRADVTLMRLLSHNARTGAAKGQMELANRAFKKR